MELWINREKRRFYRIGYGRDLLGDYVITRDHGSLDSARGRRLIELAVDKAAARCKVEAIRKQRVRRGYTLIRD